MAGLFGRLVGGATHFLGADTPEGATRLGLFSSALKDIGSGGETDALGSFMKDKASRAHMQEVLAQAQAAGLSPLEMVMFQANQGKFAENYSKEMATNRGYHGIDGGNTGVFGDPLKGGTVFTAPKLTDHNGVYGLQTPTGYTGTGQAAPSYEDTVKQQDATETARRNSADERLRQILADIQRGQLGETGRHNRATEGLGVLNYQARKAQGGFGTPGGGMGPDSDWETIR